MPHHKQHWIFGDYVNAWSIQYGLRKLGQQYEDRSQLVSCPENNGQNIPAGDTLFFTDERWLQEFIDRDEFCFLPRRSPLVIDDKLWFYDWLKSRGEQPIPYNATLETWGVWPVLIKARHSWQGSRKLPRGFLCRTPEEFQQARQQISDMQLTDSSFCTQQFISSPGFVYSVCGHFDATNNHQNAILVTRKTLSTVQDLGTGTVVDTVSDPEQLLDRTARILNALNFSGPFELEFLHDTHTGKFYVLELNPRFWMQHGIFIDGFDNLLLKRYLGLDTPVNNRKPSAAQLCWINRVDLLTSLVKADWKFATQLIRLWRQRKREGATCLWYPDLRTSIRFLLRICLHKLSRSQPPAAAANPDQTQISRAA